MSQIRQKSLKGAMKTFFKSRFGSAKCWWIAHRRSIFRVLGKAVFVVAKIVIEKIIERFIGKF